MNFVETNLVRKMALHCMYTLSLSRIYEGSDYRVLTGKKTLLHVCSNSLFLELSFVLSFSISSC